MKNLYLIGGTMGVGKTTACRELKKMLPRSVYLDGDWCWDADPFVVDDETTAMVTDNICHLLNNFIKCTQYENIIFSWVMHRQEIIDDILSRLNTRGCRVHKASLICTEAALKARLERDVAAGLREADIIGRSLPRLPLYQELDTVKIDVTDLSPQEAADRIALLGDGDWRVYYDGNFWGRKKGQRPGREIPVNGRFAWGGCDWVIPAVYACGKGLVVDAYAKADSAAVKAFLDKWRPLEENSARLTEEQREQAEQENPLMLSVDMDICLNGRKLMGDHGCGAAYTPFLESGDEAQRLRRHYSVGRDECVVFMRNTFKWNGRRPADIDSLQLTLRPKSKPFPGTRFTAAVGDRISLIHPVTGAEHVLTVKSLEMHRLPENAFGDPAKEYPRCCVGMEYTITPPIAQEELTVRDCAGGDKPRRREIQPGQPAAADAASVGIIGGADGPVAVILAENGAEESGLRPAVSALYFDPPAGVDWRCTFYTKLCEDITVALI